MRSGECRIDPIELSRGEAALPYPFLVSSAVRYLLSLPCFAYLTCVAGVKRGRKEFGSRFLNWEGNSARTPLKGGGEFGLHPFKRGRGDSGTHPLKVGGGIRLAPVLNWEADSTRTPLKGRGGNLARTPLKGGGGVRLALLKLGGGFGSHPFKSSLRYSQTTHSSKPLI